MDHMKLEPDATDEVHDALEHVDPTWCRVTPVTQFAPSVAQAVVEALSLTVRSAHASEAAMTPDDEGIIRAQVFEEGDVYMLERPFDGYFADRYLMDFYDVEDRDVCSRMHIHTGLRFVRMMTGTGTSIRVSSFTPFAVIRVPGVPTFHLEGFADTITDEDSGTEIPRHNLLVPPCSWVDMQVPRGVSHQFNALGPNAVIDSVHPEESIEMLREEMSGYCMVAQTIFLAKERQPAATCRV